MSPHGLHVVHNSPGRMRVAVDGLRRNPSLRILLEASADGHPVLRSFSADSRTGTVLLHFPSDTQHDSILQAVGESVSQARKAASNLPASVADAMADVVKSLKAVTRATGSSASTMHWHLLTPEAVTRTLTSDLSLGLSTAEARKREQKYGKNELPESIGRSPYAILVEQFKSAPAALLGVSAALSVLTGGVADAVVILVVLAANAGISYRIENQADDVVRSLTKRGRQDAIVVRDGKRVRIPAAEIVPGDLLVIEAGAVMADARLVAVRHLTVDESALTGESVAVEKTTTAHSVADAPIADRTCMIYRGTVVTGGTGLALVTASGLATELGRVRDLLSGAKAPPTPLEEGLRTLSEKSVALAAAVTAACFGVGILRGQGLLAMLKSTISLAVAAVPEGLPTVATTTLALGAKRLAKRNVVVRRLAAIEALGAAEVVCFDKTGTLTANEMQVVAVECPNAALRHSLLRVAVLCAEARAMTSGDETRYEGSATEIALLRFAAEEAVYQTDEFRLWPLTRLDLRTEKRLFMVSRHRNENGTTLVAIKGSPEQVLAACEITAAERRQALTANAELARRGLRVLGFASREFAPGETAHRSGLTWLGTVGIQDRPRAGVHDVIKSLHGAGIATVMMTGDQAATAYAVAKDLGLNGQNKLSVVDAGALGELDPNEIASWVDSTHIFSRVNPSEKLRIVEAFQRAEKVVVMTGDGINDSPALRAADVGFAMGDRGTDVACDAADAILSEGDLGAMVVAIREGRTIRINLEKSVSFMLATNMSEIFFMFGSLALGWGQALTPTQLLWINLVTDVAPGLALATDVPSGDVMTANPISRKSPLLGKEALRRISRDSSVMAVSSLGVHALGRSWYGAGAKAGSMGFMSLTLGQLLYTLGARDNHRSILQQAPLTSPLKWALVGTLGAQIAGAFIPGLRGILSLVPLSRRDWAVVGAGAVLPLLVNEFGKRSRHAIGETSTKTTFIGHSISKES